MSPWLRARIPWTCSKRRSTTRAATRLAPPESVNGGRRCFGIDSQRHRRQKSVRVRAVAQPAQANHGRRAVLPVENVVFTLQRAVHLEASGVRRKLRHIRGDLFGEKELSRMRHVAAQMNFQVDVYGAAEVPTRIDGGKFSDTLLAGQLYAPQEAHCIDLPPARRPHASRPPRPVGTARVVGGEARVDAQRIAMPDVQGGVL